MLPNIADFHLNCEQEKIVKIQRDFQECVTQTFYSLSNISIETDALSAFHSMIKWRD